MPANTHPAHRFLALPGGTNPANVRALYEALAARLNVAAASAEAKGETGELDGAESAPPVSRADSSTRADSSHGQLGASAAASVLLPVAPNADPEQAAAEVTARITGPIPPGVDAIVQTSGSATGRGHLVGISMRALEASARATEKRLDGPGQWLLCLPAHHIAGIQVLVRSALAGMPPQVLDTNEGFRTSEFTRVARALLDGTMQGVQSTRSEASSFPCYVSLVPTQLVRILEDPDATQLLARFNAVLVGGAATAPRVLDEARAAGIRVVTTYGMSETGGGCVYNGVPLDGARIGIEQGTDRIWISGPMLAEGYLDDPDAAAFPPPLGPSDVATAKVTWAPPDGLPGGSPAPLGRHVLVTSDRGAWDGGRLRVLGRVDDVILTGGIKVDPAAVEAALNSAPQVAEACVVGVPDDHWGCRVVAVLVPADDETRRAAAAPVPLSDAALRELRDLVSAKLDGAHAPRDALWVDALPARGPGKIDRRAVTALADAVFGAS